MTYLITLFLDKLTMPIMNSAFIDGFKLRKMQLATLITFASLLHQCVFIAGKLKL